MLYKIRFGRFNYNNSSALLKILDLYPPDESIKMYAITTREILTDNTYFTEIKNIPIGTDVWFDVKNQVWRSCVV